MSSNPIRSQSHRPTTSYSSFPLSPIGAENDRAFLGLSAQSITGVNGPFFLSMRRLEASKEHPIDLPMTDRIKLHAESPIYYAFGGNLLVPANSKIRLICTTDKRLDRQVFNGTNLLSAYEQIIPVIKTFDFHGPFLLYSNFINASTATDLSNGMHNQKERDDARDREFSRFAASNPFPMVLLDNDGTYQAIRMNENAEAIRGTESALNAMTRHGNDLALVEQYLRCPDLSYLLTLRLLNGDLSTAPFQLGADFSNDLFDQPIWINSKNLPKDLYQPLGTYFPSYENQITGNAIVSPKIVRGLDVAATAEQMMTPHREPRLSEPDLSSFAHQIWIEALTDLERYLRDWAHYQEGAFPSPGEPRRIIADGQLTTSEQPFYRTLFAHRAPLSSVEEQRPALRKPGPSPARPIVTVDKALIDEISALRIDDRLDTRFEPFSKDYERVLAREFVRQTRGDNYVILSAEQSIEKNQQSPSIRSILLNPSQKSSGLHDCFDLFIALSKQFTKDFPRDVATQILTGNSMPADSQLEDITNLLVHDEGLIGFHPTGDDKINRIARGRMNDLFEQLGLSVALQPQLTNSKYQGPIRRGELLKATTRQQFPDTKKGAPIDPSSHIAQFRVLFRNLFADAEPTGGEAGEMSIGPTMIGRLIQTFSNDGLSGLTDETLRIFIALIDAYQPDLSLHFQDAGAKANFMKSWRRSGGESLGETNAALSIDLAGLSAKTQNSDAVRANWHRLFSSLAEDGQFSKASLTFGFSRYIKDYQRMIAGPTQKTQPSWKPLIRDQLVDLALQIGDANNWITVGYPMHALQPDKLAAAGISSILIVRAPLRTKIGEPSKGMRTKGRGELTESSPPLDREDLAEHVTPGVLVGLDGKPTQLLLLEPHGGRDGEALQVVRVIALRRNQRELVKPGD